MKKTTRLILLVTVLISVLSACAAPASVKVDPSVSPGAAAITTTPTQTPAIPSASAAVSEEKPSIAEDVKIYLLNGQEEKPEAGKLHWTQEFLDQVDIDAVYADFMAGGGKAGDVLSFAEYLTENAPVPDNWKQLFEASLLSEYGATPSRYEDLGNGYYQVYVLIDGKEVPYVGVNARTGYFHG